MIRTIALGVVCLAGLSAIAAAAMKSTLPQSAKVVFPVVAGVKADRLPIKSNPGTLSEADKVDVAYIPLPKTKARSVLLHRHRNYDLVRRGPISPLVIGMIHTI